MARASLGMVLIAMGFGPGGIWRTTAERGETSKSAMMSVLSELRTDESFGSRPLLLSLVFFFVLVPLLDEYGRIGEAVVLVVACLILARLGDHFCPAMRPFRIASHVLSTVFFGFMSVALFAYLGRPGSLPAGCSMPR